MVNHLSSKKVFLIAFSFLLLFLFSANSTQASDEKQIFDNAGLLNEEEINYLENMAKEYGAERETDFIILTTNDTNGEAIENFMSDFYDEYAPGYDKPHGDTVILTLDMNHREVHAAGFKQAEDTFDNHRADLTREKITPDLSSGNYFLAFEAFIEAASEYMQYRPGVDPENIFLKWWVQLLIALFIAGLIVFGMAYNSGGRVTVNDRTYIDSTNTKVNKRRDVYLRKTVTKRKKPSNNNKRGGGGGAGGISRGGHSFSGSKGRF